jgi:hypothetical protein
MNRILNPNGFCVKTFKLQRHKHLEEGGPHRQSQEVSSSLSQGVWVACPLLLILIREH